VTHLIRLTSCHRLVLTANTLPKLAIEVIQDLSARDIEWSSRICEPPVLSQLYPELVTSSDVPNDPWTEDGDGTILKPDLMSTCIYLHSSGSTGLPKAIPLRHHELIKYMKYRKFFCFCLNLSQAKTTQRAPPFFANKTHASKLPVWSCHHFMAWHLPSNYASLYFTGLRRPSYSPL
jgi:acyl-CoA synthetase (AMP-forming)/AMP-acid ligase II